MTIFWASDISGQSSQTYVRIRTSMGSFVVELYNETPLHKEAFLSHVRKREYHNILFHRVVRGFMIQAGGNILGGDEATAEQLQKRFGQTIPAEILYPKYFHRKGALAAARVSNETNPEKRSSQLQFYIVVGQCFLDFDLEEYENRNQRSIPSEIKKVYMTEGGCPDLDGEYTVFGQVVKGMEVIEKIQSVATNEQDVPIKPVYIKSAEIVSRP